MLSKFFIQRPIFAAVLSIVIIIAGLVTLIAAIHYFYMRDVWVATGESPTVYRYVDWLLTVPLQIIEFYLILAAIAVVPAALFWRLLTASVVMLYESSRRTCRSENLSSATHTR